MSKRINIILPETTIRVIDRIAKPGRRSRFIDEAVRHFVSHRSTEALRARLERAAVRDQDLDREISAEWSAADKEAWQQLDIKEQKKPTIRGAVRSTSRHSTRR